MHKRFWRKAQVFRTSWWTLLNITCSPAVYCHLGLKKSRRIRNVSPDVELLIKLQQRYKKSIASGRVISGYVPLIYVPLLCDCLAKIIMKQSCAQEKDTITIPGGHPTHNTRRPSKQYGNHLIFGYVDYCFFLPSLFSLK